MTRLSLPTLVLRYAGFALLAMAANLGTQRAVLAFGDPEQLLLPAIALGTLIGLAVKYALDKRWIFHDRGTTPLPRQFALYSLMALPPRRCSGARKPPSGCSGAAMRRASLAPRWG